MAWTVGGAAGVVVTADGRTLTTCVFDLDDTLYPRAAGVMAEIVERIRHYMVERLGFDPASVETWRRDYYLRYGTALRGLQVEHQVDAEDYLAYVHDVDLSRYLQPEPELDAVLGAMPLEKVIFTNSTCEHAARVVACLGIARHFSCCVDLRSFDYYCKPDPRAYVRLLDLVQQPATACVYVDDTPRNLRPAAELGMVTVLLDPLACTGAGPRAGDRAGFDYCIDEITGIGAVMGCLRDGRTMPGRGMADAH